MSKLSPATIAYLKSTKASVDGGVSNAVSTTASGDDVIYVSQAAIGGAILTSGLTDPAEIFNDLTQPKPHKNNAVRLANRLAGMAGIRENIGTALQDFERVESAIQDVCHHLENKDVEIFRALRVIRGHLNDSLMQSKRESDRLREEIGRGSK